LAAVTADQPEQPPENLVKLRQTFDALDQQCERLAAALPRAEEVVANPELGAGPQWDEWLHTRAERLAVLEQMQQHEWWGRLKDQRAGREALRAAARKQG
jgi:hypothetical protein